MVQYEVWNKSWIADSTCSVIQQGNIFPDYIYQWSSTGTDTNTNKITVAELTIV